MSGRNIVFEGVVGTGKTTQSKRFARSLQEHFPDREIVQAKSFTVAIEPICEAYLFATARARSLCSIVKPAVDRGAIVIADRNYVCSVAFQGFGRALDLGTILKINLCVQGVISLDTICPQS